MSADLAWKVASIISSMVVIPLFGWIWATTGDVNALEMEHSYTKDKVVKLEDDVKGIQENTTDLKLLKKDVEFIKKEVQEISKHLKGGTP